MLINNLQTHIAHHRVLIDGAIKRVLDRSWLVLGPEVKNFEKTFVDYIHVPHCISVANGTDALELALRGLGIAAGDTVATAANAGFYTSTAVLAIGASPLYLEVDVNTHLITLKEVEQAIRQGAKAIVVTHLYGQAQRDIVAISDLCRSSGLALVEDCAQATGARINGKPVGGFGDAGCFSFYPTKNLGALGDGGAVVTNSLDVAAKVSCLRQYGWSAKYQVDLAGARNSRLDELQAAVLSEFLPHLDEWNSRRRDIAAQYSNRITHSAIKLPPKGAEDYVAHLYVVRCVDRDSLREHLRNLDIATDVHYPIPDYRQAVFENRFEQVLLPNTDQLAREVLTLPCYPEMSDADVDEVVEGVNAWQN